jgi:hypothetical protein
VVPEKRKMNPKYEKCSSFSSLDQSILLLSPFRKSENNKNRKTIKRGK